jgi:hypothetical protein
MRNIIFFFIAFNALSVCQNLTGYYPLEIGNMWEYWDPYDSLFLSRRTIIGDTVLSNGISYKIVKIVYTNPDFPSYGFQRQHGAIVYQFNELADSEQVKYDFTKTAGDTLWVAYYPQDTAVYKISFDWISDFYGKQLRYIDFFLKTTSQSNYSIERVVDSIGLVFREHEPGMQYFLRGAIINGKQYGTITDVKDEIGIPANFILKQNYPNPFNSETRIEFSVQKQEYVSLRLYDILGRLIKILKESELEAGWHKVIFNAENLSGGVYFYTLRINGTQETKKMIFLP